jgi:hypothetical protein
MTLREYYNFQITEYFIRHNISYKRKSSKFSDYFYITNIEGIDKHTLKIRVSNHISCREYDLPFLNFYWYKRKEFPSKRKICSYLGSYIAKYKLCS